MQVVPSTFPYIILTKTLITLLVGGVGALILLPFKKAIKEWISLKDSIASTKAELIHQRTNCLTTLQDQGEKQVELLTKVADTLEGVRLDLKEQTGYLMGVTVSPARKRRATK